MKKWITGLALFAAVGFVALLALSSRYRGPRGVPEEVSCQSNLREIWRSAIAYRDGPGNGKFPCSKDGPLASLQVLANAGVEGIEPSRFICRKDPAVEAKAPSSIDPDRCSYETVPWPLSKEDPPDSIFVFDRSPWHGGGRDVVTLDGSVNYVKEDRFRATYADQARSRGFETTH